MHMGHGIQRVEGHQHILRLGVHPVRYPCPFSSSLQGKGYLPFGAHDIGTQCTGTKHLQLEHDCIRRRSNCMPQGRSCPSSSVGGLRQWTGQLPGSARLASICSRYRGHGQATCLNVCQLDEPSCAMGAGAPAGFQPDTPAHASWLL